MQNNNQNTNKVLVVIIIVLVLIIISMFCRGSFMGGGYGMMWNKGQNPKVNQYTQTNQNQNGVDYQSEQKSPVLAGWTLSPDFNLYYPSSWRYFGYIGEWAQSEFRITNENAVISWGNNDTCSDSKYPLFQAGVSTITCLKGMVARIGLNNVRNKLTQSEIDTFGEFILKNK